MEFAAVTDGWHWRREHESTQARAIAWETALLVGNALHGGVHRKFPRDLAQHLDPDVDPDGVRILDEDEAEEHRRSFEAMKAASDRVPVRPGGG